MPEISIDHRRFGLTGMRVSDPFEEILDRRAAALADGGMVVLRCVTDVVGGSDAEKRIALAPEVIVGVWP